MARALGRSVSQMAATTMFFCFRSTGRWATCTMAPLPMIPTLSGSATRPSSVEALEARAREICRDDCRIALPCPGSADRTPLAEPDPVPRSRAFRHEAGNLGASRGRPQREERARQDAAVGPAEGLPHPGALDANVAAGQRDDERGHAAGGGAAVDPHVPDARGAGVGDGADRGEAAPECLAQLGA